MWRSLSSPSSPSQLQTSIIHYNPMLNNSSSNNNSNSSRRRKQNNNIARTSHLCQLDCGKENSSPVCGMDNVTYRSRCELHQTVCKGKQVRLQYRGECSECKLKGRIKIVVRGLLVLDRI